MNRTNIKFTVILISLLLIFQIPGNSQYSWYQMNNFGGTARYGAVGFVIDSVAYVGLGKTSSGYVKDFWKYSPKTDTWTKVADFGGSARAYAVAFTINNKGYIVTGEDASLRYKDLWEYNPSTNQWIQKADFGGTARSRAVGFVISNKGYVGTGYDGTDKKDLWEYDPTGNAWAPKTDLPSDARETAIGFAVNGKGYICAGINYTSGSMMTNDVYAYDPLTNAWTQKSFAESHLARTHATSFVLNDKAYVCGGLGKKDLWEYNAASNTWNQLTDFGLSNETNRFDAVGFTIKDRGYVGTGEYMVNISNTQIKNDMWTYSLPLPPKAPTYFSSPFTTNSYISLSWYYDTNEGTGFIVERSNGNNVNFEKIDSLSSSHRTYSDFNLSDTTSYYYRIKAVNTGGYSPYTNEVSATTKFGNPTSLIAVPISQKQIDLIWQNNSTHGEKYFIERSAGDNSHFAIVDSIAQGSTSYSDTGLIAGTKYYYRVFLRYRNVKRYTNINSAIPDEQGSWRKLTDYPDYAGFGSYAFIIGNKYYAGYTNYSQANALYEYDIEKKKWTQKMSYPGKAKYGLSAFSLNGKAYVGLGRDDETLSSKKCNDFWEYDPDKNTWTPKADFAGKVRYNASALAIGMKGYIGFGTDDTTKLQDIWEYDPSTNGWNKKANCPRSFSYGMMSVSLNNVAYFGLGDTTGIFYSFDPASNLWTKKKYFNDWKTEEVGYGSVSAFSAKDKIFVLFSKRNSFWEYDTNLDTWKRKNAYSSSIWPYILAPSCTYDASFGYAHPVTEGNDNGGISATSFYMYDPAAPTSPTDLKVTDYSLNSITLKWKDNSSLETKFMIERKRFTMDDWVVLDSVGANQTTYVDTKVSHDSKYFYRVCAKADKALSNYTNEVYTVSGPPFTHNFEYIISKYNTDKVYISYKNVFYGDDTDGADTYILERSDESAPETFITVGTFLSTVKLFTDSGLVIGAWYNYRLKATNKVGSSEYIKTVKIKVGSVCMFQGNIKVDKTTFFDAEGYNLEYHHCLTKVTTMLPSNTSNKLTADFKELFVDKSDTLYIYDGTTVTTPLLGKYTDTIVHSNLICARNTDGALTFSLKSQCSWSNDGKNTGWVADINSYDIVPPSDLKATAKMQNISLLWQDNSEDENYFIIERSVNDDQHFAKLDSTSPNVNSYTDNSVVSTNQYYYRVKAMRNNAYSIYSNLESTMLLPAAPSNLDVKTDSSKALLSWKDNSDNELRFIIECSYYRSNYFFPADTTDANVTAAKYALREEIKYYFRIRASNLGGPSGFSNVDSAILLRKATNLTSGLVTNKIVLNWADNSSNELFYRIERSVQDSLHFEVIDSVSANTKTYTDTHISSNTTYYYRVKAVNAMAESSYSNTSKYSVGVILGVEEISGEYQPVVYPNPTHDKITVKLGGGIMSLNISSIELLDISGVNIRTIQKPDRDQKEIDIDLSELTSGVYYLRIKTNRGVIAKSFIKQ